MIAGTMAQGNSRCFCGYSVEYKLLITDFGMIKNDILLKDKKYRCFR